VGWRHPGSGCCIQPLCGEPILLVRRCWKSPAVASSPPARMSRGSGREEPRWTSGGGPCCTPHRGTTSGQTDSERGGCSQNLHLLRTHGPLWTAADGPAHGETGNRAASALSPEHRTVERRSGTSGRRRCRCKRHHICTGIKWQHGLAVADCCCSAQTTYRTREGLTSRTSSSASAEHPQRRPPSRTRHRPRYSTPSHQLPTRQ